MANDDRERPFILRWRSAVLNSSLSASAKLCHLVLAEYADTEGGSCYPSATSIARLASMDERTIRRALGSSQFFERAARGRTGQAWRTFNYRLTLPEAADTTPARSTKGQDTTPAASPERCGHPVQKVRTLCPEGAGTVSDELGSNKDKEQGKPARLSRPLQTYKAWSQSVTDKERTEIGERLWKCMDTLGVPEPIGELFFTWADRKWADSPKKYRNWPQVFMTALRDDWHRLWRFGQDGSCYLTTAGEQLRRLTTENER